MKSGCLITTLFIILLALLLYAAFQAKGIEICFFTTAFFVTAFIGTSLLQKNTNK